MRVGIYILLFFFALTLGSAATLTVPPGGDFQAALNIALPGDTIVLSSGATYSGNFILPNKPGANLITVTSSAFPQAGTGRVSPGDASKMAKLITPNGAAVLSTAATAHHYQFIGIELAAPASIYTLDLFMIGSGVESSASDLAHDFILDRVYIHGDPRMGCKRGVALNGAAITVKNSYISDIKSTSQDSQALAGWNGPGPFTITNNYLESSGENLMFGGTNVGINGLVPSDITITGNYLKKPNTWRSDSTSFAGTAWLVKNLLELKNAQRVTISGNVFENSWVMGQDGTAIVLTVRTENGAVPWAVVQDIAFQNNLIRHVGNGVTILGQDDANRTGFGRRMSFSNNLFQDIGNGGGGRAILLLDAFDTIKIDHNTLLQGGHVIAFGGLPGNNLTYTNNISPHNTYGVFGDGVGTGIPALNMYARTYTFTRNVLAGGNAGAYPSGNYFPTSLDQVGFTNAAAGDYTLSSSSPYRAAATDGKDLGADIITIMSLAALAQSGGGTGTVQGGQVAGPAFSLAGGTYGTAQQVSLSTTTAGASIRYTTNNSTPTSTSGTLYSGAIPVSNTATIKAIAYAAGMTDSTVSSATYTISTSSGSTSLPPVSYTVPNGEAGSYSYRDKTYTGAGCIVCSDVALSGGLGQLTDGTVGLTNWSANQGRGPAYEWVGWYTLDPTISMDFGQSKTFSQVSIHSNNAAQAGISLWQQVIVDFSSDGVTYTNPVTYVPSASERADSTARYINVSVNGTGRYVRLRFTRAANSWLFLSEIQLIGTAASGGVGGQVAAPSFSAAGGTYSTAQQVSLSTTTAGASIRYTTDNSTPTSTSGTLYSGAIPVSSTVTIKAIAYMVGMSDSVASSATYTISAAGGSTSLQPVSYTMPNGEAGSYSYRDKLYNGTGCITCSGAALSGGIGQLTDGKVGLTSWLANQGGGPAYEWVGWYTLDPVITLDLGQSKAVTQVSIHSNNAAQAGISLWQQVIVDFSSDGATYTNAVTYVPSAAERADTSARFTNVPVSGTGRFIRLRFTRATNGWLFLSELQLK